MRVTSPAPGISLSQATDGTMTHSLNGTLMTGWHKFSWTNAMVVALGAALTGDITVCTLAAKTIVQKAIIVITGQGAGTTTLTVALGKTSPLYIDYVVASDAKVAANTVYGQAFAEVGTNLSALVGNLPSLTATTAVKAHFIATVATLDQVTGSSGDIYLELVTLP